MHPIIWLLYNIVNAYFWIIIAAVVMSWLIAFNVVNLNNDFVRQVYRLLGRLTEPLLAPIRRFMPDLGGIDISPIILIFALQFLQYLILYYGSRLAFSAP
ncbi:MAG TPA: YggT family protein [Aestuariivirga sp.]|nr:YggT family protein [Aestuariivirga sp.]